MIKFSAKTKSVVFVATLMLILFSFQIYQNNLFYKTYIEQIRLSYSNSFENFYKSFIENESKKYKVIVSHFSRKDVLSNLNRNDNLSLMKDLNFHYLQLKNQDRFLKDIFFVDKNLKFKIGKNSVRYDDDSFLRYKIYKEKISYENDFVFDSVVENSKVNFIFVFGVFNKGDLAGFVEVVISAKALLLNLRYFDGSDGFILTDTDEVILGEESFVLPDDEDQISIKDKSYILKRYEIKDIEDKKIADSVFLLDITDKNEFYNNSIKKNVIFAVVFFIAAIAILNFVFSFLITKLERSNLVLNKKINLAIRKERQKDKLLIYQSKLAGTGEMIANIAHQWRQPLMQLSSINMLLEALYEKNRLNKLEFDAKMKDSNEIISYMSRTIDDFRNFYKPDKEKEIFDVKDAVMRSISIIKSSLEAGDITYKIACKAKNVEIYGYKNEFSQAVLNILSNSKDALANVKNRRRNIRITILKDKSHTKILLQDNAGGIDESIVNKIFDPYFTTKHSFQGTGIGLYMSKMIIEGNMNGEILVSNELLEGEMGAMFKISFKNLKAKNGL